MSQVNSLEVLVSTMHQENDDLIKEMNIQSDAIIVNQCDDNKIKSYINEDNSIKFMSFNERGVGLSRNTALMRAEADICLMADDDVTYVDGYKDIILNAFNENPSADMIVFNVPSKDPDRPGYQISNYSKVKWYNCLRYPTYRMAFRTKSQREKNIYFSLLFGGGAKYSHGEDSLFIWNFIQKNSSVYASPEIIGYVDHGESTWFEGYTDQYFFDKGVLYSAMSKRWSLFLTLQFLIRRRNKFKEHKSFFELFKLMNEGTKEFK